MWHVLSPKESVRMQVFFIREERAGNLGKEKSVPRHKSLWGGDISCN